MLANKVAVRKEENEESRCDGNFGETKFQSVTWKTSKEKDKRRVWMAEAGTNGLSE